MWEPAVTLGAPPRRIAVVSLRAAVAAAGVGALAGLAAAMSPKLALAGAVGLAFVGVGARAPAAGLALFTILSFFSVITAGSNLTVVKMAGLALVVVAGVRVLRSRGRDGNLFRDRPWVAWLAVALGMWALSSMMWALSAATAESNAVRLLQGIVLIFVVYASVRTPSDLRLMLWAFMAGALLASAYGLVHGSTNPNAATRLSGGIGDPNELAASLVPSLAFAFAIYATSSRRVERVLVVGCATIVAVALFLTQSRGGLVALTAMVIVTVLFAGRLRRRALVLAVLVAGVGVTYFTVFASSAATARISSAGDGTGRVDLWSVAVRMIGNHPLGGVGMGNFPSAAPAYTPGTISLPRFDLILFTPEMTHNTYLQTLAELGAVGLIVFAGLVAASVAVALRATRRVAARDTQTTWLTGATVVAAVGLFAAYVFFSAEFEKQLWLMLGLLAAVPAVAARAPRRDGTAA